MSLDTLVRLGLAGSRTDRLRTVLTAAGSALAAVALLSAATVASIKGDGLHLTSSVYSSPLLNEPGLRPGVVVALVLLTMPVLALAGQCVRLGAPARDRRLAAVRLAGATPRQTIQVAMTETALAGLIGSVAGFGVFMLLRVLLESRDEHDQLRLPTDVMPSPVVVVALLLVVPGCAALIGALLLRRVAISPLGVLRRGRTATPKPWPGLLIVAGLVIFDGPSRLPEGTLTGNTPLWIMGAGALLTMIGVVLGTGWISYTAGRILHRFGQRPAMLLAGRRLMSDPWNGSRTLAAMLFTVVAGGIALGIRQSFLTAFALFDDVNAQSALNGVTTTSGPAEDPEFYLGATRLVLIAIGIGLLVATGGVLVAMAESIVARRRSYAALTATGVPRKVLSESVLWHTFTPVIPAVALALTAGIGIARIMGTTQTQAVSGLVCHGTAAQCATEDSRYVEFVTLKMITVDIPVPWSDLIALGAMAVGAMMLAAATVLMVLRASTNLEELRTG